MWKCCVAIVLWVGVAAYGSERPAHISEEVWQQVYPYLLSDTHPLKGKLDALFSQGRLTASEATLRAAGFIFPKEEGHHVAAVKRSDIAGYLLKIYVDSSGEAAEWKNWIQRIEGARFIRQMIAKQRQGGRFKVPMKWIYPLPTPPPEGGGSSFILVVQDMDCLDRRLNHKHWRMKTDAGHLRAFYRIVTACGLRDSCGVANAPWCRDKKIAFVDTEYYKQWPVNYHPLLEYLNRGNCAFWKKLTAKGSTNLKN